MSFIKTDKDLARVPNCFKIIVCENQQLNKVPLRSIHSLAPYLKYIYLSNNQIPQLPNNLFRQLPHLIWLDMRWNNLTELPQNSAAHSKLRTCLLNGNRFQIFPIHILKCPNLITLSIRENPLKKLLPNEIFNDGIRGLRNYFDIQKNDNLKPYKIENSNNELKIELNRLNAIQDRAIFRDFSSSDQSDNSDTRDQLIVPNSSMVFPNLYRTRQREFDWAKRREMMRMKRLKSLGNSVKELQLARKYLSKWKMQIFVKKLTKLGKQRRIQKKEKEEFLKKFEELGQQMNEIREKEDRDRKNIQINRKKLDIVSRWNKNKDLI